MSDLVREAKEIYKKNKHLGTEEIFKAFKKAKWKQIKHISFKRALYKMNLVVKFPDNRTGKSGIREVKREIAQYKKAPKWMRSRLAKLYGHLDGLIIQEKIEVCKRGWKCEEYYQFLSKIADRYFRGRSHRAMEALNDGGHNHGHKEGEIVFFDWVYKR